MWKKWSRSEKVVAASCFAAWIYFAVLPHTGPNIDEDPDVASTDASDVLAVTEVPASAAPEERAAYGGMLMDDRERALYAEDPSSMGYTVEDREFLREHGVSEAEARALETIAGNPD